MKKYIVELSIDERKYLQSIVRKGKAAARKIQHAQILLRTDSGPHVSRWTDSEIARTFSVNIRTVERIRKRFVEYGLEDALIRRSTPSRPYQRKFDGDAEARLATLACSAPPEGYKRWTIRLLTDEVVKLDIVDSVGRETVRTTLKKMKLNRG